MKSIRRHLTYANVVATLALLFAMSGGALAANHYLVNSTKQINPKVLKKLKGASGAQGAHGLAGANGAQGPGGPVGPQGQTGTINTANFYDKSEADERFAAGNTKFMAGRLSTGLTFENLTILEIPGLARVFVLNCAAGGANAEIDKIGSGTDFWAANGTEYSGTNWASASTPFTKAAETTYHIGNGNGSSSRIATIDVTTATTGSQCVFGVSAQVVQGG
jgi:hypothetical protein